MSLPPAGAPFLCPKCGGFYEVSVTFGDDRLRGHVPGDSICKERQKVHPATKPSRTPAVATFSDKSVLNASPEEKERRADLVRAKLRREGVTGR